MSILFAVTLAAASTVQPSCSWDRPGANPYTGNSAAAIDRYTDIPAKVRGTLKRRMAENQSDDAVLITRDGITGKNQYDPAIRDMHFGAASVCATVTRAKWSERRQEPGAVYCVDQHCILVPRICGNVSRVTRLPAAAPARAPAAAPPAATAAKLGDGLDNKDLGLADAEPAEPEELTEDQLKDRERERLAAANNGVPEFDMDDGNAWMRGGHPFAPDQPGDDDGGGLLIPTPVPEADTWAMLLGGLAVLGVLARRRQRGSGAPR